VATNAQIFVQYCPLTFAPLFSFTPGRMSMWKSAPILIAGLILCGCKSGPKKEDADAARPGRTVTASTGERPSVRPVQTVSGRILAVRDNLRFVILDFGPGKMPRLEQRLWAYRLDQKVAELKVSGPFLGTTVAADIIAGEAREGDLVREQ
jgi:hypothetical protein